jgi:hypothetical protein
MERIAMTTWKLDWCDVYRDAGSYGAVVRDSENQQIALMVEVMTWDHPTEPRNYRCIWEKNGEIPDSSGTRIEFTSNEFQILWSALSKLSKDDSSEESRNRFSEMLEILKERLDLAEKGVSGISLGTVAFAWQIQDCGCAVALANPLPSCTVLYIGDRVAIQCSSGYLTAEVCGIDAIRETKPQRFTLVLPSHVDHSEIIDGGKILLIRKDEQSIAPKWPIVGA